MKLALKSPLLVEGEEEEANGGKGSGLSDWNIHAEMVEEEEEGLKWVEKERREKKTLFAISKQFLEA